MTALLVIIIVLLIVLIIWAFGITVLYAQLVRTMKAITNADTDAMNSLFGGQGLVLSLLKDTLDATEAVSDMAAGYQASIDQMKEESLKNTRFALDTIQQARRIYNASMQNVVQPIETTSEEEAEA